MTGQPAPASWHVPASGAPERDPLVDASGLLAGLRDVVANIDAHVAAQAEALSREQVQAAQDAAADAVAAAHDRWQREHDVVADLERENARVTRRLGAMAEAVLRLGRMLPPEVRATHLSVRSDLAMAERYAPPKPPAAPAAATESSPP